MTADQGGYDLESTGAGTTHVRIFNVLEGHGIGKLLVGLALSAARKDADAFGRMDQGRGGGVLTERQDPLR